MGKNINLEHILDSICKDENKVNNSNKSHILNAIKEACYQTLELAAENADTCQDSAYNEIVDKDSILNTINQIE